MKKYLLCFLIIIVNLSVSAQSDSWPYNTYITCISGGSTMTQIGSNVKKTIGISIANSGSKDVNITKLAAKDPDTNETISFTTDASVLGELKSGEEKGISVTINKDIWPKYEITYSVDGTTYDYIAEQYKILTITANKYGTCLFAGIAVGAETKKFSLAPSSQVTLKLAAGEECTFTQLKVNSNDVTSDVVDNSYTIASMTANTTVIATFDNTSGFNPTIDGHEYVDLGLPSGCLWSIMNYGANDAIEYGDYRNSKSFNSWGENWTMPTKANYEELISKCTWTWTTTNDVNGYSIKGPNGNTMFLPAAGSKGFWGVSQAGKNLNYMTSSDEIASTWVLKGNQSEYKLVSTFISTDYYSVRPISTKKSTNTGITNIIKNDSNKTKIYTLTGTETNRSSKGVVVIKTEDGRTKKYIMR